MYRVLHYSPKYALHSIIALGSQRKRDSPRREEIIVSEHVLVCPGPKAAISRKHVHGRSLWWFTYRTDSAGRIPHPAKLAQHPVRILSHVSRLSSLDLRFLYDDRSNLAV
jgi:hypothetical protein